MLIIDSHAHIFDRVKGVIGRGAVEPQTFGKLMFGDGTIKRFMPPLAEKTAFLPEMLLEEMDYIGVDKAVLLQGPLYGDMNNYVHEAVKRWPDRFVGAAYFDPWLKDSKSTFNFLVEDMGFKIIKMELSEDCGYAGLYPGMSLNDLHIKWMWEDIESRRLVVVLDLGPIGGKAYQTDAVKEILENHPDLKMVITHLCYPPIKAQNDEQLHRLWREQVLLARRPNVYLDLASLPAHAKDEDYPYLSACKFIHKAVELVGVDKLLWGSDIPGLLTVATYSQLLDYIRKHCEFLSQSDKAKILGENALQVYNILSYK